MKTDLSIVDMYGRTVFSEAQVHFSKEAHRIDISQIPSGVYIVLFHPVKGSRTPIFFERFVKN